MERTRVVMLESHAQLFEGEEVNLPHETAHALVAAGVAQLVHGPAVVLNASEVKVVGPSETKVVTPKQTKKQKSK